jgi:putative pyruvate formate lyase activating enzyme
MKVLQPVDNFFPAYLSQFHSGELKKRAETARERLRSCDLCARECQVDRLAGERGACRTGEHARVSSYGAHPGEEAPLSGWNGSGTIFFTRCNLGCIYCQNSDISQSDEGAEVSARQLAAIMLALQEQGCHNINLVSPSHVAAQILAALVVAAEHGLRLPLVYNTGGYDPLSTLRLLDGVVDIYMPDMKYADAGVARRLSGVENYPQVNQAAVREMHRQVGDLQVAGGLAQRGLLVRHLVLPGGLAGSEEIFRFLAEEISTETYLNVMDQYHPAYHAWDEPILARRITPSEYTAAVAAARKARLSRLDHV